MAVFHLNPLHSIRIHSHFPKKNVHSHSVYPNYSQDHIPEFHKDVAMLGPSNRSPRLGRMTLVVGRVAHLKLASTFDEPHWRVGVVVDLKCDWVQRAKRPSEVKDHFSSFIHEVIYFFLVELKNHPLSAFQQWIFKQKHSSSEAVQQRGHAKAITQHQARKNLVRPGGHATSTRWEERWGKQTALQFWMHFLLRDKLTLIAIGPIGLWCIPLVGVS